MWYRIAFEQQYQGLYSFFQINFLIHDAYNFLGFVVVLNIFSKTDNILAIIYRHQLLLQVILLKKN